MQKIRKQDLGYWLFVDKSNVYLVDNQPLFGSSDTYGLVDTQGYQLGMYNGYPTWLVENNGCCDPAKFISMRSCLMVDVVLYNLLSKAIEFKHFLQTHKFCGICGHSNQPVENSLSIQCTACNKIHFPVICPSIIVAVRRDDHILLANHVRHKQEKMYTVLAGFIEVGETPEQAVHREVFEETGIQITNIQYYNSQAWAFPNSLMVGFLADYQGGEIKLQDSELVSADWFNYKAKLPVMPPQGTLARDLIETSFKQFAEDK